MSSSVTTTFRVHFASRALGQGQVSNNTHTFLSTHQSWGSLTSKRRTVPSSDALRKTSGLENVASFFTRSVWQWNVWGGIETRYPDGRDYHKRRDNQLL